MSDTKVLPKHYNVRAIDPIEYCNANRLDFVEGNVVKYVSRYKEKNGLEDLDKLVYYATLLRERYRKDLEAQVEKTE